MKDIQKIKLIHNIKHTFSINKTELNNFISQIESSKFKNDISRFFKGYTIEDKFRYLFSVLPRLKLVHSLDQNQLPLQSKEIYQVPDHIILYETATKTIRPIIIEVKSVKGGKQAVKVMSKQLDACVRYARILNVVLLYAIFWEKYQFWTLNTIENFERKIKTHTITLLNAAKNDLSAILGDFTFIVNRSLYRKTICDKSVTDPSIPKHTKYGSVIEDKLSFDLKTYIDLEPIESAVIDAYIKMEKFDIKSKGNKTILIERSSGNYLYKLSTIIARHIAVFGSKFDEILTNVSGQTIFKLMKKLNFQRGVALPSYKTNTSDKLFNEAFEGTWILDTYKKS